MEPTSLLPEIDEAFKKFLRPTAYVTEGIYEPERIEYESMLGGKPREEMVASDFGSISWSPLINLAPDAAGYLLPRLIELAESGIRDQDGDLFLMRVVNFLAAGPTARQFALLNAVQRAVLAKYLQWQSVHRFKVFEEECWDFALEEAVQKWCADA